MLDKESNMIYCAAFLEKSTYRMSRAPDLCLRLANVRPVLVLCLQFRMSPLLPTDSEQIAQARCVVSITVRQSEEFGKDFGLVHEAIVTGRKVGAGKDFWSKLAHDEALFQRVVELVDPLPTVTLTVSQERAREIMGSNFHGPDQVAEHFRVRFTEDELGRLAEVPFSEDVLESCKDTHILVAGYPLSILEVKKRAKPHFWNQDWYIGEPFAKKTKPELRWYLVRKTAVPNSFSKTWAEQQELLETSFVPQACVMVYSIVLHFLATGERLFERTYVRCQDVDSGGYRVDVGRFDAGGLGVRSLWDDGRSDRLGLAAARN